MTISVSANTSNFLGVGHPIDGTNDIEEALRQSKLDFTVSQHNLIVFDRKTKVQFTDPNTVSLSEASKYNGLRFDRLSPIVRDDTMQVIAIMGSGYKIVQNRECVQTMADILALAKEQGEPLELFRGGIIKNCDYLFISAKLPKDMEIRDPKGNLSLIQKYLVLEWSHTGAGKVCLSFVSYDPICNCFLYPGTSEFEKSIRHTKNASTRLDDAAKYLNNCYRSFTRFQQTLEELTKKPIDVSGFKKFLEELFPDPENTDSESSRGMTRIQNKRGEVEDCFRKIGGETALDAYKSVCKYQDEEATVKQKKTGKNEEDIFPEEELRLFSSFKGTGAKVKQKALTTLNSWF